jgi:hypothetical protein
MGEEEKKENQEGSVDVRETPAFRGVVKQLEDYKRQVSELSAKILQLDDDRARKDLESKGQYEQALSQSEAKWQARLSKAESDLASIREAHAVASVELGLAAAGIAGRARTYLAKDYAALGDDRPELAAWIDGIRANPEYSSFFQAPATEAQRVSRPGDGAGRAAGSAKTEIDWRKIREEIKSTDPRISGPAIKQMTDYIRKNGGAPPKDD